MSIINKIKNCKNININIYTCKKCNCNNVDEEEFKPVDGFDNYLVSNFGNIKNSKTNKILKLINNSEGYKVINLFKNKKVKMFRVHRLVAIAFLENPDNKPKVDHIDNNPSNNNVKNLRWATSSDNSCNRGKQKNNTTGFKGVSFNKKTNKYRALININGKLKHLGYYESVENASKAYEEKAREIHGEFYYKNK